jgi:hypothetical protein
MQTRAEKDLLEEDLREKDLHRRDLETETVYWINLVSTEGKNP